MGKAGDILLLDDFQNDVSKTIQDIFRNWFEQLSCCMFPMGKGNTGFVERHDMFHDYIELIKVDKNLQ